MWIGYGRQSPTPGGAFFAIGQWVSPGLASTFRSRTGHATTTTGRMDGDSTRSTTNERSSRRNLSMNFKEMRKPSSRFMEVPPVYDTQGSSKQPWTPANGIVGTGSAVIASQTMSATTPRYCQAAASSSDGDTRRTGPTFHLGGPY